MSVQEGRLQFDPIAWGGNGFPDLIHLAAAGNIGAFVSGLDAFWVPMSYAQERHQIPLVLADWQANYQTQGAGGTGSDTFILREIDGTPDIAGTGTVSSSATAITGSGTAFQSLFAVGDLIRAAGQTMRITAITSNTAMTIEAAPGAAWSGASFWKVPFIRQIGQVVIPANAKFVAPDYASKSTDLRANGTGINLMRGRGVRLDSGAIGSGYSTTPAGLRLRIAVEGYGIVA